MSMGHGMGPVWRHMRTDRSATQTRLKRETFRRVLSFAGPHRRLIGVFLALTVVDAGLVVVSPLLVQRIIDDGITQGDTSLVLWLAGVTLFAWGLVKWTRTGAHMVATGEADEAARLSGIATFRMKRIGLLLSGILAAITAVLLAANLSSAAPNMAGDYLLYAIAAVLLGMTMFEPGKPNVPGTVFAALVLKVLGNGLVLLGAPYYVQDIVLGAIIIGSVAFSASAMKKAAFKV